MRTLLRIDSSARKQGSHSRALADHFQSLWLQAHPGGKVILRDLAQSPVPHLQNSTIAAFNSSSGADANPVSEAVALSDTLIAELKSADHVLVGSALYNFNVPSTLKAWVDHVVRSGHTFGINDRGYFGMLRRKSVCIVTARGGTGSVSETDGHDLQGPYLRTVFEFLGFDRIDVITLEGTVGDGYRLQENLARARMQIASLEYLRQPAASADTIEWLGAFTARDRDEINALRARQVQAILQGDAAAYALNCTDDILLMLQGHDVVAGRSAFVECETRLLETTKFEAMRQIPLRVERRGDLAVEVGRQEVVTACGSAQAEQFKARRKYTHVLRRTAEGWRFAILMSSNNE